MTHIPNTPTPAALTPRAPEILSRADILRRRMASEKQPEVIVKRKGGWPKGKKRK